MEENQKKHCKYCGTETKKFWICDGCYPKMRQTWEEQKVVCWVCKQNKTSSKIEICSACKSPFVEEAISFLKSKPEYWNLIKERLIKKTQVREKGRKFKCSSEICKTEILINEFNEDKVIWCPSCVNIMNEL